MQALCVLIRQAWCASTWGPDQASHVQAPCVLVRQAPFASTWCPDQASTVCKHPVSWSGKHYLQAPGVLIRQAPRVQAHGVPAKKLRLLALPCAVLARAADTIACR